MTLKEQFDFGAIHSVANARGGQPVDQASASVAEYLRQKHMMAIDLNQLGFAVNTIDGGLRDMERGLTEKGRDAIRDGMEWISGKIEEARNG